MKNTITICLSNSQDLEALAKAIKGVNILDANMSCIQLVKQILDGSQESIITEDSFKGEMYAMLSKLFYRSEYFIWFDDATKKQLLKRFVERLFVSYSKAVFARSKQMKLTLNKQYKKKVFVIYPWIKEYGYKPKTFQHRVFSLTDLNLPEAWSRVSALKDADLSILKLEKGLLNHQLPKVIFQSIEHRLPTVIIYPKPKTVNKIFKYIKHVKVVASEAELDFNDLEFFAQQNLKFKVPKKLRWKYNLSNFKKFIK